MYDPQNSSAFLPTSSDNFRLFLELAQFVWKKFCIAFTMPKKRRLQLLPVIKNLIEWRKAQGFSQRDATNALTRAGVPVTYDSLQNWETGRCKPVAETAFALHDFLLQQPAVVSPARRATPAAKSGRNRHG